MPKGISKKSPLQDKVINICNDLLIQPNKEIIDKVEKELIEHLNPTMVYQAHQELIKDALKGISSNKPKKPKTPNPTSSETASPSSPTSKPELPSTSQA